MSQDPPIPPPDDANREAPPEPPRRSRRAWRLLGWTALGVVVAAVLALAAVYAALTTERGTRLVWRAAVALTGGRLTGTLEGGTLARGVRLARVRWFEPAVAGAAGGPHSLAAAGASTTDIRIDHLAARWALTRAPWRFTLASLDAGTIETRLAPSTKSEPMQMPTGLTLPLELEIGLLRVGKLRLIDGASVTELGGLRLHGRSDGRHHSLALDSLGTPYGALTAQLALDGVRPFALAGELGYGGELAGEPAQASAHLSGTLESLVAELRASGFKLTGVAHIEASPFAAVPLKRATLSFAHVNPQVLSPGAPAGDLSLEAELAPVPGGGALVVAGPVSIVNAKPGRLHDALLPLIDAHADVRLDALETRLANIRIGLVDEATLTGAGRLAGGRGRIDLRATGLDLNTLSAAVRPTALSGPIAIGLDGPTQSLEFDLADKQAGLAVRAKIALDRTRLALHDARVAAGRGHADLTGTLARDANSSYSINAALSDFEPALVMAAAQRPGVRAGAGASASADRARSKPAARSEPVRAAGRKPATASPTGAKTAGKRAHGAPTRNASWPEARISGTFNASGVLAPDFTTKLRFKLVESVYDGLPLTGAGTVQLAGNRLLPSDAVLSIAGNGVELHGSFGGPGDRLRFHVGAPRLDRLGFDLAGTMLADGDLTGSLAHPNVTLTYDARGVVFGENRVGSATGRALARDGANGALEFTTEARDIHTGISDLATLSAHVTGTRAKHAFDAAAKGAVRGRPVDMTLAAAGGLAETPQGWRWDGVVSRLVNRGMPALELRSPLTVKAGREFLALGATRLAIEGASLELKSLAYDHGAVRSAGSASNFSLGRLLTVHEQLTGVPSRLRSDLVFAGDWDFSLGHTATGYFKIDRVGGDLSVETGRGGIASLGITALNARAQFGAGARLAATLHAAASRIGSADANLAVPLAPDASRGGMLGVAADAPLAGTVAADLPSLKTTGGLFGPSYVLDGRLALRLTIAGTAAKPSASGMLTGDRLSATFVDQGVQLKDGVVRIALAENLVDFQHVEFRGGDGTLRATGRVRLDEAEPDLTAQIVADKLELFAAPDRQLSLSGSATVANAGTAGGMNIDGKFKVDHALFDMPEEAAPRLSDDVVIVRNNAVVRGAPPPMEPAMNKPVGRFAPRANVDIDLGHDFRFRGRGADLGLYGTVTVLSAPNQPLRAVGNVRVTEGSTYTSFGRKLSVENGFFTFNGPVANPGINILAMRRNQEVEAGVQVTGTVHSPTIKLVSEPNVPDDEKLSWLLFGHGTDQGNNLGQQSSMTTALALLGSATGKRVAKTIGLDEFNVGRSDVGLTDSQVVMLSKAINERLVLGYEQGLQSASNAVKATINLSRFWSLSAYTGTFQGVDVGFTRRFDGFWSRR